MTSPIKHDEGKARFTLLPWKALREVVAVREYGIRVYKREHSWQEVEPRRYVEALLRHGAEIVENGILACDEESGLLHTAHIACNALFLTWFALRMQPATVEESPVDDVKDKFKGSGRIKRDVWPFVVVHASATGWYLKHTGWNGQLFNTYGGGCWYPDERDATAFPSAEAATEYLCKQAELNARVPGAEKGGAK